MSETPPQPTEQKPTEQEKNSALFDLFSYLFAEIAALKADNKALRLRMEVYELLYQQPQAGVQKNEPDRS